MRESKVETYLHAQVTAHGGTTRKFTGRINVPDRIVIWGPWPTNDYMDTNSSRIPQARIHFVECKAPEKGPRPGQVREHNRLRAFHATVKVLNTFQKIDDYVSLNGRKPNVAKSV